MSSFLVSLVLSPEVEADICRASLISEYYPKDAPTGLKPAASTSLASALHSVETSWQGSPQYTTAVAAIYSAAPSSVKSSIDKDGYYYRSITGESWYTKSVPHAVQTAVAGEISAFSSVGAKFLGTSTSKAHAAARTAAPMFGAAVGLVGGVLAAM